MIQRSNSSMDTNNSDSSKSNDSTKCNGSSVKLNAMPANNLDSESSPSAEYRDGALVQLANIKQPEATTESGLLEATDSSDTHAGEGRFSRNRKMRSSETRKLRKGLNEAKVVRDLTSAIMCLFLFYMALTLLTTVVSLKFIIDCRQMLAPCTQQSSINPCWKTIAPIVINCSAFIVMFCSCCCSSPRWLSAILWISAVINGSFAIVLMLPDSGGLRALQDLISHFYSNAFYYKCDAPVNRYSFRSSYMDEFDPTRSKDMEEIYSRCLSMVSTNVDNCNENTLNRLKLNFYCSRMQGNEKAQVGSAIRTQLASLAANVANIRLLRSNATISGRHLSADGGRALQIVNSQFPGCLRNLNDFTVTNFHKVNIGTAIVLLVCALINLPIGVYIWRLASKHHELNAETVIGQEHRRGPFHSILIRIMPLFQALHTDPV